MESPFNIKYHGYNWSNIILHRLISCWNAGRHGRKESFEQYSEAQKHYYLETQKCIAAQREIIIFGSKREAENQLKTYLLSPHMLDIYVHRHQRSVLQWTKIVHNVDPWAFPNNKRYSHLEIPCLKLEFLLHKIWYI